MKKTATNDNKKLSPQKEGEAFEQELKEMDEYFYTFSLYVNDSQKSSMRAMNNVYEICEQYLKGRYELKVVDVNKEVELAKMQQIVATPTLVRGSPPPVCRLIGDLANAKGDEVLLSLAIMIKKKPED